MLKRIDENTGREIRQLTAFPEGVRITYFRFWKLLPDGRVVAIREGSGSPNQRLAIIDVESGDLQMPKQVPGRLMKLHEGRAYFAYKSERPEIWMIRLPDGEPELVGTIPEGVPGDLHDIACDGSTVIMLDDHDPDVGRTTRSELNYERFWRYMYRPRSADLYAYNLVNSTVRHCAHLDDYSVQHIDVSPVDPGLLKFAQDGVACLDQRIWAVRTDGTQLRKIRPQEKGEWVHHEFWWPDGQFIAYKYIDRRNDPTFHELPWGEKAPRPLQLGIADLNGKEVYLSEPLTCYQTHLNVSPRADFISGEGTEEYPYIYAGAFSWDDRRIDLKPFATIHTPYQLSIGQDVDCSFSADSRWLLYNDQIDGVYQVCAVMVDL